MDNLRILYRIGIVAGVMFFVGTNTFCNRTDNKSIAVGGTTPFHIEFTGFINGEAPYDVAYDSIGKSYTGKINKVQPIEHHFVVTKTFQGYVTSLDSFDIFKEGKKIERNSLYTPGSYTLIVYPTRMNRRYVVSVDEVPAACNQYVTISNSEFEQYVLPPIPMNTNSSFMKRNGQVQLSNTRDTLIFKDRSDSIEMSYTILSEYREKHWLILAACDEFDCYYYVVNTKSLHIDTLIGTPKIFPKNILCAETLKTDCGAHIEVWGIVGDSIFKKTTIRLSDCPQIKSGWDPDVDDREILYVNDGFLYFYCINNNLYYKKRIE